jgi:hypothetical protein
MHFKQLVGISAGNVAEENHTGSTFDEFSAVSRAALNGLHLYSFADEEFRFDVA